MANSSRATYPFVSTPIANMGTLPLGFGGAILDLDWFLNYRYIKLVIQASEIEGTDDLSAY